MSQPDVIVVGAGVAGLSCALALQRAGHGVRVLEAADAAGGRVRTDSVHGFRLDRGFQVLLTAYPEVQREIDLAALRPGAFLPGAWVRKDGRFERLADPFRRPGDVLRTALARVGTLADRWRIARLRRRVRAAALDELLRSRSRRAEALLREEGFSAEMLEAFFRPFFGGVFLERGLDTSSRFLEFAFRMFSLGDAVLPAGGMQAVPEQLAARLASGTLRLGARVAEVGEDGVRLEGGERLAARATVVATAAGEAARLLPELPAPPSRSVACLYFDAERPPAVGRALVLDGEGTGPVNHLCVPSEIAAGYAPAGRALVSASVLAPALDQPDDQLERAARRQLGEWFGAEVTGWRLLRVVRVAEALPRQEPGPFEPGLRPVRVGERRFVCGDFLDVASLQGAMRSGRRAAAAVAAELAPARAAAGAVHG
jgi:phytoene dehydrogenase-like protein